MLEVSYINRAHAPFYVPQRPFNNAQFVLVRSKMPCGVDILQFVIVKS